ncbi:hypothetical protein DID76_01985, partial [Candidatus Marinamargulisbacteria bacterium SCGC AG-414-C22]
DIAPQIEESLTLSNGATVIYQKINARYGRIIGDAETIKEISIKIDEKKWDVDLFLKGVSHILDKTKFLGSDSLQVKNDSICFNGYSYKSISPSFISRKKVEGFYFKGGWTDKSRLVVGKETQPNEVTGSQDIAPQTEESLTLSNGATVIYQTINARYGSSIGDEKTIKEISIKIDEKKWDVDLFLKGVSYFLDKTKGIGSDSLQVEKDSILFMGYKYKETSLSLTGFVATKKEGFFSKEDLMHRSRLVFGKETFPRQPFLIGHVNEGEFLPTFLPKLERKFLFDECVSLVDGKTTWRDGRVEEGQYKYSFYINGVYKFDGKKTWRDGRLEEGRFKFCLGLGRCDLVEGKKTWPGDAQ